jgi:hypothetical protein
MPNRPHFSFFSYSSSSGSETDKVISRHSGPSQRHKNNAKECCGSATASRKHSKSPEPNNQILTKEAARAETMRVK